MISTLVEPEKWRKLKVIAAKTGTTVMAIIDDFLTDVIEDYEENNGKII